jgi:hypothetical protein
VAVPVVLAAPFSAGWKAVGVTALLAVAEVAFWLGTVLLGVGVFQKVKAWRARRALSRDRRPGDRDEQGPRDLV